MPTHPSYTLGPARTMNLPAAAEMAGCIACIYAGDQPALVSIIGPLSSEVALLKFFVSPTNTRVACAMWTQPGHLFVAFGGTHAWHQWPRHLTGAGSAALKDDAGVESPSVGVHGFHQAVARGMWDDHILPTLPDDWQGRELRITGHSLGGSVAQLVAWRFAELGHDERTQSITFGAPRAIQGQFKGARPYAEYRVTNESDIIALLPHRYSAVFAVPLQLAFAMRNMVSRGTGLFGGDTGASLFDAWTHYGDGYQVYPHGIIEHQAPDTARELAVSPFKAERMAQTEHIIPGYIARLEAAGFAYGMPVQSFQALDIGRAALANPANPVPAITIDPRTGMDLAWSNSRLAAPPLAPLTAENAGSTLGGHFRSPGVGFADSTLKDTLSEDGTVALWDLTVFVNNDRNGTSNTVALDGATETKARSVLDELAKRRANLLGNDDTSGNVSYFATNNGPGSPAVEYGRIRDAQNPRVGDVYPLLGEKGEPWVAPTGAAASLANAADPLWVSVNLTLRATRGAIQRNYILKITGVPDKVIARARYDGNQLVGKSNITFDNHLRALVDYLTNTSGESLGCSGFDPANEQYIEAWAPDVATGMAKVTLTAHGYETGDQVRITRTKWWYLNRTWEVARVDANNFLLKRSQITAAQVPPSLGRALLVVNAAGVKQTVFYRFVRPTWMNITTLTAVPVRVTKKRPGPRFDPVSFSPNRKRIKR